MFHDDSSRGLDRLVPMLDQCRRWDRILDDGEQQRVAFARAVIHAPPWLLIDQVLDSLDDETRRRVDDVIVKDLARSGVIHIGRTTLRGDLFERVLRLVKDSEAHCFQPVGSLKSSTPPLARPEAAASLTAAAAKSSVVAEDRR